MTRTNTLQCVHEPFGDAYYYGPERLGERYEKDEKSRTESGFGDRTFNTIFDRIDKENTEVGSFPSLRMLLATQLRVLHSAPNTSCIPHYYTAEAISSTLALILHFVALNALCCLAQLDPAQTRPIPERLSSSPTHVLAERCSSFSHHLHRRDI